MGASGLKCLPKLQITAFAFGARTTAVEQTARQLDALKAMRASFAAKAGIRRGAAQKNAHGKRYAKCCFKGPVIFDRYHRCFILEKAPEYLLLSFPPIPHCFKMRDLS